MNEAERFKVEELERTLDYGEPAFRQFPLMDQVADNCRWLISKLRAETERRERLERRIRERIEEERSDHGGLVFTALARVEAYEDVLGMLGALDTGEEY